jgi:capsular exopolysaccharide synthesis family protein
VIVSLVVAYIYLRYTTTLYESKATVIIKEDLDRSSELSPFSELGGFFSRYRNNEIENELAIFRSKRLITDVVRELELNILYESIGAIKTSELYEFKPLVVQFLSFKDSSSSKSIPKLYFEIQSASHFKIENESETIQGEYDFGELVSLPFGEIIVIPSLDDPDKFEHYIGKSISLIYRPIDKVSQVFQNRIKVNNDLKNSNVVELRMQSPVTQKSEDFINELIFQYNKDAINDRNQVAQKTSNFIDSRLDIITQELDSVERNKVEFKSSNRLTNIEAEAQLILENASEFSKRQFDVSTQLELANTMIEYMENASSNDLLPANIGLDAEEIGEAVNNYNALILQRNKLLKSSTAKNPVVVNLNNQITQFRNTILESLKNTSNALKISMRDLDFKESALNSKITGVPAKEKIYRDIERQQIIKEQLYLFLLKQREEANISLAVTAPKAKIVDRAYSSSVPVYPKKALIYLGAFLAGLIIPFLFIYIRILLNTRVTNRRDLERVFSDMSIIGEIPKVRNGDTYSVNTNDRGILAESFRILRTNLQYLFINKLNSGNDAHTVFVTSSIKGEGKTFVAYNLALTLALTGKKVVLVGADIRNPQLHRYLSDKKDLTRGLTNYIIDPNLSLDQIIQHSEQNEHLKIILSGDIPPNPAELLMLPRTKDLFDGLKESFDYVIVDTAPSVLVTDTILINKLADVTLYVIRAGFTEKKLLDFPKEAIGDGRLSNVALVLNHVDMNNFGYGNKYGYSYSKEKQPFYKRLFR